jgi:hypothetical protein
VTADPSQQAAGMAVKLKALVHFCDDDMEAYLEVTGCPIKQHARSIVLQVARQMQAEV